MKTFGRCTGYEIETGSRIPFSDFCATIHSTNEYNNYMNRAMKEYS